MVSRRVLLDVAAPFPGRLLRRRGAPHLADQHLLVLRVARRRTFDDQVIADFEGEPRHASLRELRHAAPLAAPLRLRAVLVRDLDQDERMGIPDVELDDVAFSPAPVFNYIVQFPGHIKAGVEFNEIISHQDWFPTILALAGDADIKEKLKKGHKIGNTTYKVHLDGLNLLPYLTGKEDKSPREGFIYFTDDGDVAAIRYDNWKMMFMEQRLGRR